jgi:DNA helicase IV
LLDQAVALETARQWTKEAEDAWKELEEDDIFMEERKNDGNWIRSWRQAISSFRKNSRMISTAH